MCLVTRPEKKQPRRTLREEEPYYAPPRPVSNYHGGQAQPRSSATYVRRTVSTVPVERASYERSYRASQPRVSGSAARGVSRERDREGEREYYSRTSRTGSTVGSSHKHRFAMSSLRGIQQPELSKKLYKLIKTENHQVSAYETASRESQSVASQLSEWGETQDDAVSDISDKLGVLLAEIAEQEDLFAQHLEDSRGVLKQIRNTESSVQPTRNHKTKIQDEIQKLKYKEPTSPKLVTLEQELVRAEAQSLVAEAQLTNVTRQKFKEAYDLHTAAIIERAEKQIMLAQQARRLVNLLDDTPTVPGEERAPFENSEAAREVLNDAEAGLRNYSPSIEPIHSAAGRLGVNAMPGSIEQEAAQPRIMQQAEEIVQSPQQQETVGRGGQVPYYSTSETTYVAA
ncbi:hypothetical protein B0A54_05815 [Friedmanniomyces endolithicus]|uniref:Sphingolipid long chain base-responsive protein LSP1 n=2 Tax=Friedmanniomyces endolithicus TaxID=329885 RepID=A0A4U0V4D3_9PEZI|nr:hypothetical protein B0A54_05815 [Friedmanniomyces endolithicus]